MGNCLSLLGNVQLCIFHDQEYLKSNTKTIHPNMSNNSKSSAWASPSAKSIRNSKFGKQAAGMYGKPVSMTSNGRHGQ